MVIEKLDIHTIPNQKQSVKNLRNGNNLNIFPLAGPIRVNLPFLTLNIPRRDLRASNDSFSETSQPNHELFKATSDVCWHVSIISPFITHKCYWIFYFLCQTTRSCFDCQYFTFAQKMFLPFSYRVLVMNFIKSI